MTKDKQEEELDPITLRRVQVLENHIISATAASAESASHSFKTLILLNGGAVISVLALLPALLPLVAQENKPIDKAVEIISEPIFFFVAGLVCAFFAIFCSYYANLKVTKNAFINHSEVLQKERLTENTRWQSIMNGLSRRLMQIFTLVSIGCFAFGFWEVRNALIEVFL